jgi:hypothetical protein
MRACLLFLLLVPTACAYREQLGDIPSSECKPECPPPGTCGGSGSPGVCGVDPCGGCFDPFFPNDCQGGVGGAPYKAERYLVPGTCDPDRKWCSYRKQTEECPEDCADGVCVRWATCTLTGLCKPGLDCKWITGAELRCTPAGSRLQGMTCDEASSLLRCSSHLACVKPSYVPQPVCAHLCQVNSDCVGGLRNQGVCIKDGSLGAFGFCE